MKKLLLGVIAAFTITGCLAGEDSELTQLKKGMCSLYNDFASQVIVVRYSGAPMSVALSVGGDMREKAIIVNGYDYRVTGDENFDSERYGNQVEEECLILEGVK